MKESKRQYFSGESLEQAVMSAARHYGVDADQVVYERVEKRHGFLKVRRKVVIQVDVENPFREASEVGTPREVLSGSVASPPPRRESPDQRPRSNRGSRGQASGPKSSRRPWGRSGRKRESQVSDGWEPEVEEQPWQTWQPTPLHERYPAASGKVAEAAQEALEVLLDFAVVRLSPAVLQGEGQLEIDLSGADESRVAAEEGRILLAIQHLLPRLIHGKLGERVACRVDCNHFQEVREERLRDLAQRAATEVRRSERPRTLRSMNPADRRIVHVTLEDDPAVVTESSGEGYYKRITVRPA